MTNDEQTRLEIANVCNLLTDAHSLDVMLRTAKWLLEAEESEKDTEDEGDMETPLDPPGPRIPFDPHDVM